MTERGKIRILFGKPGLDGHDVGAKVVVRSLMEAGFDVTYTGLRQSPEEIVSAIREQKPDVLGLSILSGSHLPICRKIAKLLSEAGLDDILWIVGGNIPEADHESLRALGVDAVFGVGTPTQAVVDHIRERTS
jgi:methylmalonyl-CoA mutase C-terminal domain/subunit